MQQSDFCKLFWCWDASNPVKLHENEHCTLLNVFISLSDVRHRMNSIQQGTVEIWNSKLGMFPVAQ